ncbi:MAG: DUF362 domain-containing protein [Planctomycetota bacterium]
MSRREFLKGLLAAGGCGALSSVVSTSAPTPARAAESKAASDSAPARWAPVEPPNQPVGQAKGIFPGRVVWVHEPKVAQWDGDPQSGGWFEDKFTDPALADQMLSRSLRLLSGAKTDAAAWTALFRHFNQAHGRGNAGYQPGEKVAVKLNLNCSKREADPTQGLYNTPQLTMALLRQLVEQAGVPEADLVVYDASRLVNESIFLPAHAAFPGIRFEDRDGGEGRFQVQPDKSIALHFGDPSTPDHGKTYLPACVTGATYLVNAALLKGHSLAGVTLCGKNHFGSVYRENTGPTDPHKGWNPNTMHEAILARKRPMGTYNPVVDLMGHKDFGGKTVLYLLDALYAAPHQNHGPERWQSPPFAGHWTASVFTSQDPVAIESVAVDFSGAEETAKRMVGAVDNYLHEAALAPKTPSGTRYAPEGGAAALASLGVHEHWNGPEKRQYSRNLGTGQGIELLQG